MLEAEVSRSIAPVAKMSTQLTRDEASPASAAKQLDDPGFMAHPSRHVAAGEIHARPFHPAHSPMRFLHFAFVTNPEDAELDREQLGRFCAEQGVDGPGPGVKHHRVELKSGALRWEQHSEFATYTWELVADPTTGKAERLSQMRRFARPGLHLVSIELHLNKAAPVDQILREFDPVSLAMSYVDEGAAILATDFRCDEEGFVRIVIADHSLTPERAGALVQRVLELETYRTLAALGLPEAQRLDPRVRRIEGALVQLTRAMTEHDGFAANQQLLDQLTALAATLEADAAASLYRFGASRAYYDIVKGRLRAIGEQTCAGYSTIAAFLSRRLEPAMRTCASMEERQANLSRKLSRAAQLLRTRVEVELQRQNRSLLAAMNERIRLQFRLQQTVEGLSIAAVSYYLVALLSFLLKGAAHVGLPLDPVLVTAGAAPIIMISVTFLLRRITRKTQRGAVSGSDG